MRVVRQALLGAWLGLALGAIAQAAPGAVDPAAARPAAVTEAGETARDFYRWYLTQLREDRDPLHDRGGALAGWVARPLMTELESRAAREDGLDADYFLKAQDYADDWVDHIDVRDARRDGRAASVQVDLGIDPALSRRLTVTLVREGARWKIRRVVGR